jgi:REP element-mobilizing transposase RayT
MSSHIHLIIGTSDKPMQDILRDFKSYTSRKLKEEINQHPQESRKDRAGVPVDYLDDGKSRDQEWK